MHHSIRQRNTRLRSRRCSDRPGHLSSDERKSEEYRLSTDLSLMKTSESSHPTMSQNLSHGQGNFHAKEGVLTSLHQDFYSDDPNYSKRLETNKKNMFEMLRNISSICFLKKIETPSFGSNLLKIVENLSLNVGECKEEFTKLMINQYATAHVGNTCFDKNSDSARRVYRQMESVNENNFNRMCYPLHEFGSFSDSFSDTDDDLPQCNDTSREIDRSISLVVSSHSCSENRRKSCLRHCNTTSSKNIVRNHHQTSGCVKNCKHCPPSEVNYDDAGENFGVQVPPHSAAERLYLLDPASMDYEDMAVGEPAPISHRTAVVLKELILGSASEVFSPQWVEQSFTFNKHPTLLYGFVQKRGGACGVLSAVQAFLLKSLMFDPDMCGRVMPLRPTIGESLAGLARAITHILWQAGQDQCAVLATPTSSAHLAGGGTFRPDGLTETLAVERFVTKAGLEDAVLRQLNHFVLEGSSGCLFVIFSAVLSRGLRRVLEDMDEPTALIGPNGHCVQELVNLLLTGRACSNVFDDTIHLDTCTLKGVHRRAEVGFLSLYEHYNSCQVGSYLKNPNFPIWVVCSDSHFTVLFSCRKELVHDPHAEALFELYFYDSMAQLEDEVKLTVDTTGLALKEESQDQTPLLEHCVRTKWRDAVIVWNGHQHTAHS